MMARFEKDPLSSSEKQVLYGRDSKTVSDAQIGFINRDELITSRLQLPQPVNALGADFKKQVADEMSSTTVWSQNAWFAQVASHARRPEGVPGLMTLYFEPVLADRNEDGMSVTHQSYLTKWLSQRSANNNVKNWQPGDEQFVDTAAGLIKMYLAFGARAIAIMRDVAQHSENRFYNKVAMLKAMGFDFTEQEIATNFDSIWSFWNRLIVPFINSNEWLQYTYPGIDRWAALCEVIYRDNPAKTTYAQHYVFCPSYMVGITEEYDAEHEKIGWIFTRLGSADTLPVDFWDRYRMPNLAEGTRGTQGFFQFMNDVYNLLKAVFYNDDTKDIIATLNMISVRGYETELSKSTRFNFARLEFTTPEQNATDHSAPVIYDSAMLLAIHNCTICEWITSSDAYIRPSTGRLSQELTVLPPTGPAVPGMGDRNIINAYHPKVINFPNTRPTQCDMINATQWTVVLPAYTGDGLSPGRNILPSTIVGSDFIKHCEIITRASVAATLERPAHLDPDTDYASAYTRTQYSQKVIGFYNTNVQDIFNSAFSVDVGGEIWNDMSRFEKAQQFAMYPMCSFYLIHADGLQHTEDFFIEYEGPIVQSEVYYVVNANTLSRLHSQWKANFWGYPIYDTSNGNVDLTVGGEKGLYNESPNASGEM